MLAIIICIC